jgi:hypothetical protein
MTLADLVGIPWQVGGRSLGGIDCVGLAILAQKVLCGRDFQFPQRYGGKDQYEKSEIIKTEVERLFVPIEDPEPGALGLFFFDVCWHVTTFTDRTHFLHVFEGERSRISRLTPAYRRYLKGVYAWREP